MIGQEVLVSGGATGLLAVVVLLILRGYLVPRRNVEDLRADRDYWRAAAKAAVDQNAQLLESARVTSEVLKAFPRPGKVGTHDH